MQTEKKSAKDKSEKKLKALEAKLAAAATTTAATRKESRPSKENTAATKALQKKVRLNRITITIPCFDVWICSNKSMGAAIIRHGMTRCCDSLVAVRDLGIMSLGSPVPRHNITRIYGTKATTGSNLCKILKLSM